MRISTLANSKVLEMFSIRDFIKYLEYSADWQKVDSRTGWVVFDGVNSRLGKEIVLPVDEGAVSAPSYKAAALSMMSDLINADPEIVAQSVDRYESDLLYVRNVNVRGDDSVPLEIAVRQLQELKSLVQFATDMEIRATPYDVLKHTTDANRQANHYRFGHTFRGSFGFTIEAPLMTESEKFVHRPFDRALTDKKVPTSRRVMERLARGIKYASQSAENGSADWLVNNYEFGLNANMCSVLVSVAGPSKSPVEYRIMWSPVLSVASDVSRIDPVLVDDDELVYLEIAETRLKELREAVPVSVWGYVKHMGTTDDPLGNVAKRTIVLKWMNNPFSKRVTNLTMDVDAEAYGIAHPGNLNWDYVLYAEGDARYVKSKGWILENPTGFRLEHDETEELSN